jgi:two-component system, cell cycle sensor histidine kinase and response regulator CckA
MPDSDRRNRSATLRRLRELKAELTQTRRTLFDSVELTRTAMKAGRMFAFEWNPITDEVRRSADCGDILGPMLGATRLGKDSLKGIHPDDQKRLIQTVKSLTPENASYEAEYRVIDPGGKIATFHQSARAFFNGSGRMTRLIGMTADVTESRQDAATLRESELRYKEVFDNFSECIFLLDVTPEGRFKFAGLNPAEEKAVGLTSAEVAGRFVEDVLDADLAKRVTVHYQQCVEAGRMIKYDDALDLPHGRRHFHTNLIPLRDACGRICRIVGCCIDVTDLKNTQEQAIARQKLESVGVLAGGIAHDFNNLLGSILTSAELALEDLGSSPAAAEIQRIKGVALRAAEIVRELMIYTGQETAHLEPLDISHAVDEMLQLLKVSISKHAVLKTELRTNLSAVQANAAQIRQVVMNLITNSSDAIGERDGVISVTTVPVTLPKGEFVRLEVSDTGCGMTRETRAKIFEPFFTTKFAGRGLGMAVVQSIVHSHGGTIDVESEPGQGTRVQILLPCIGQPVKQKVYNTVSIPGEQNFNQTGSVLFVEDEVTLRLSVSKMLRKKGFTVVEAGDGSAAMDLFRSQKDNVNVILLDMNLPGLSSREVIAQAAHIRPDIKIVLTSAYSREKVIPSLEAGCIRAFVRKPFALADLVEVLRNTLAAD